MTFKENDFVKVDFDLYANGKLTQTTDEKKAKQEKLDVKKFGPQALVIGKAFILKALDEDVKKAKKDEKRTLELTSEQAYGKRKKDMIKTFPKSSFDEQKIRPVPGITYDFNGMYGTVKSVVGGRVMVDFNNPLAGKNIKIEYKVVEEVKNIKEKIDIVFENVLRLPQESYSVEVKEKDIKLKLPEQFISLKEQLLKSLEEFISEIKDYTFNVEALKK